LSLYLHLERGEVNERTPSNGRVCSMPAKRSGRYGNTPLRYYSAKSSLVLAFHTGSRRSQQGGMTAPTVTANQQQHGPSSKITSQTAANHHGDGSTFGSASAAANSSIGPYGFKGTYRFIRKSRTSFCTQCVFPSAPLFNIRTAKLFSARRKLPGKCFFCRQVPLLGSIDHSVRYPLLSRAKLQLSAKMSTSLIASSPGNIDFCFNFDSRRSHSLTNPTCPKLLALTNDG